MKIISSIALLGKRSKVCQKEFFGTLSYNGLDLSSQTRKSLREGAIPFLEKYFRHSFLKKKESTFHEGFGLFLSMPAMLACNYFPVFFPFGAKRRLLFPKKSVHLSYLLTTVYGEVLFKTKSTIFSKSISQW